MAALTNKEIEQLMQRFNNLREEAREIYQQLMEAGAWPLDDDQLDGVAGGKTPIVNLDDDDLLPASSELLGPDGKPTDYQYQSFPGGGNPPQFNIPSGGPRETDNMRWV